MKNEPTVETWQTRTGTVVRVGGVEVVVSHEGRVEVRQDGQLLVTAAPDQAAAEAAPVPVEQLTRALQSAEGSGVPLVVWLRNGSSVRIESTSVRGRILRCSTEDGAASFPISMIAKLARLDGRAFLPRAAQVASPGKQPEEPTQ